MLQVEDEVQGQALDGVVVLVVGEGAVGSTGGQVCIVVETEQVYMMVVVQGESG